MSSLTVMIIRHAEKPLGGPEGAGVNDRGVDDEKSLTVRGWQRAGAWAALFAAERGGADFPRPSTIYAANAERPDADGKLPSRRPLQTVAPLAARLGIEPRCRWAKDDVRSLADEIGGLAGVVLVAWEHKKILPDLLSALLGWQRMAGLPDRWPASRFDVVLRLDRADPGSPWSFRQMMPCLLAGDPDLPIGVA